MDLSRALPGTVKFSLSHLSQTTYLLSFDSSFTDQQFKTVCSARLKPLGYIAFPWSPAISTKEHTLGYKVWLDIADLPPHFWSLEELAVITAPFGLILAHPPFKQVASFERLRLAITTDDLRRIPKSVTVFLNGRVIVAPLVIVGWTQETTPFNPSRIQPHLPPPTSSWRRKHMTKT
jgi:hypothetical protein